MFAKVVRQERPLETFDWLRGTAALTIVFFHAFQHDALGSFLFPRAFVAVDFFFILSGFVLAYRYGRTIRTMDETLQFIANRMRRLYPLYLAGSLIGAGVLFAEVRLGRTQGLGLGQWEAATALAIAILPFLADFDLRLGAGSITSPAFPLDVPGWSLFLEVLVNLVFALARFSYNTLLVTVAGSFVILCLAAHHFHSLNIGWGLSTFGGGFARVTFGFFFGVLLERLWRDRKFPSVTISPFLLVLILTIDLCLPNVPGFGIVHYIASVCIVFPVIILLGADNTVSAPAGAVFIFLGRISYALYVVHYPILELSDLLLQEAHIPVSPAGWGLLGIIDACVAAALAAALTLLVDEPIRRASSRASGLASARRGYGP
jgi:peptidoglycan/LPS O-acetylase OafA/YrhL